MGSAWVLFLSASFRSVFGLYDYLRCLLSIYSLCPLCRAQLSKTAGQEPGKNVRRRDLPKQVDVSDLVPIERGGEEGPELWLAQRLVSVA